MSKKKNSGSTLLIDVLRQINAGAARGTENLADARQYSWTDKEPNTVEAEIEFSARKSVFNLQTTTPLRAEWLPMSALTSDLLR